MDRKAEGVHATSTEFARYDQVDKKQRYHLAESAEDAFDDSYEIRTCDLGRWLHGSPDERRAFARELGEALEGIGFAILEGHGVPVSLWDEAHEKVLELYRSTSVEERMRYRAQRHGSVNQGYFPIKETSDIHPDLVEGWVFCRRAFALGETSGYRDEDFWPRPGFEPLFRRLCLAQEALIQPVMQSLLTHLGCDPHLYDARLAGTNFGLRLNYYPPLSEADDRSGARRRTHFMLRRLRTCSPSTSGAGRKVKRSTSS